MLRKEFVACVSGTRRRQVANPVSATSHGRRKCYDGGFMCSRMVYVHWLAVKDAELGRVSVCCGGFQEIVCEWGERMLLN